ncbi:uncharacterized protein LOC128782532 [Vidua chalybeata]|uniref:uncharacterized protein LOC128782532 n=1 Tax=Vidua chalybeata TaxID=81927 RepID=UPI0023A7B59B|nr:uncharacterized protein LOC128782532 [Vidua chalybeata]XP_053788901.1 uncharacterized protein LOC128782532 [Vidua chalybeata]XP_053788902.1 uncharacterized protein LOC128782532 [Vidua chalybeata]XP_053788903.1 uncharacterized protein LOC128782532 [Vidua chalybeata]XP_053788904.1 uncharacterized protein LOC128782532 [Vidua chalybeata]XP_053788905.1 uncharacterized protein LOC128782532 [Vidua chalybeata]XP_053788906.1 uncharacterized protein LOC128782532 [Vidua chalybeata]
MSLFKVMMSFGVKACLYLWSLGFFEVLIALWSLELFSYPEVAPVLSLIRSFCSRGALTRIFIGLGLAVILCKGLIKMLLSAPGMYNSWLWLCTKFVMGEEVFQPLLSFSSSELFTSLLGNVLSSLTAKDTIFLLFNLITFLYTVRSLYKMKAEISRGAGETSDLGVQPRVKNPEWCGKWEDMGKILKEFSDPVVWDFPSEHIQNPAEVAKYLKGKCQDNLKEKRIIAVSWALAYAYCTLLDTVGQQTEEGGQGDKPAAIPVTQAAANSPGSNPVVKPDCKPQPMAVATSTRSGKCTEKTDRPVDDNDEYDAGEGPSTPPDIKSGVKASGTRSEANIDSFSLKDLRGLRKDYRRQPDESIISWLVRLWDAAGEATILDGTEARHLGSLSHDPVIDQGMMRGASPQSLWEQVLDSVAQRYLCANDLYVQQTRWKTIEQGIQRLREMAVVEIIFSEDVTIRNPDLVPCTPVMWRKLVRLGPPEYASALPIMKREEVYETVLDMAKKLRAYADAVHGPTHARIAAVETRLQELEGKIEESRKKLREEIKEDLLQISAVQIRGPGTQRRRSFVGERRYTPRAELWFFLCESGENMRKWDRKPTAVLAQRIELKEGKKRKAAPVARSRTARYDDDMSDPLEGTSKTYAQGKKDNQA